MKTPLITVLMPVYNGEKHVTEAINSIIGQTYKDFELLIINDGSTDKTEEIVSRFSDSRIKYIKNETNLKLIATLNKGIELAKGKYIARMDADDIALPQRLERQVVFLENHPNVIVAGSWYKCIGDIETTTQYPISHEEIKIELLYQCPICHPSVMWRVNAFIKFHFRAEYLHAEDYDLWSRLIVLGEFANIPEVLLKYRIHQQSVSRSNQEIQNKNSILVRLNQFEKMGLNLTQKDSALYTELCYANWSFFKNKAIIKELGSLLNVIVVANNKSKYIAPSIFEKYLLNKWYHLNYNCGNESQFYSLSIAQNASSKDKLKLKIKSLIKK